MPEENTTAIDDTPIADGTGTDEGQATASELGEGEPKDNGVSGAEPSGEGALGSFKTPDDLMAAYKELQRDHGKKSEAVKNFEKRFEPYGGVDKVSEYVSWLAENPRFHEFLKKEQQSKLIGDINLDELDDDTRRGLELVQKISSTIADQRFKQAFDEKIKPMVEARKNESMNASFKKMDEVYGAKGVKWRDFQDTMAELALDLPASKQDNPSFKDIDKLFWAAVAEKGKVEEVSAKFYQQKLNEKKSKATDQSKATVPTSKGGKMTFEEAFEEAKRQLSH